MKTTYQKETSHDKLPKDYKKITFFSKDTEVAMFDFTRNEFSDLESYYQNKYLKELLSKLTY